MEKEKEDTGEAMAILMREKLPESKERLDREPDAPAGVMIEVRHLVKRFRVGEGEVTVLKDISLQVEHGEFVAIVGPSGSGKTTLLNMFTGIDRPSEGEVEVQGTRIDRMSEGKLARWRGSNLGLVFQFFQLLPSLSLVDNVVLPMDFAGLYSRRERRSRAMHLLEVVGLAEHANKLPAMVSGGEQQRAAIARALANDPPLLVCDEPTGNLDTTRTEEVFELFLQLVQDGKTLLIVTHDQDIARRTPRVVELMDGRIARDEHIARLAL